MTVITKRLTRPNTFKNYKAPKYADVLPDVFIHRRDIPKEVLAAEASTQGWDSASVVRLSQVNQALSRRDVSPTNFSHVINENWELNGIFDKWCMMRGGSGSIVFLRTPMKSVTMKSTDITGKKIETALNDVKVSISIKLKYFDTGKENPGPEEGDLFDLKSDPESRSFDDPTVVVQNIDYGSNKIGDYEKALFQFIVTEWFNKNMDLFKYVFSIVSLNQIAENPNFQWLKPTYTSYAYYDGNKDIPSEDQAYFGVLTMTNGTQPTGLASQLPASAIPPGQGAALLIGMGLYLENMILPGVQAAFPGSTRSDFKIANDNSAIELVNNLKMDPVRVGALDYVPVAESFIMQIVGDEIQTRSKISIDITPGIVAYVTTESWHKLTLITKPDNTQTIGWEESRTPKKDHYYEKELWVVITEGIVAIIGAVAAIVGGVVLQGVLRVVVVIVIAVVAGIAAATPELIARVISDGAAKALPSIEKMLTDFISPVEWPDTKGFVLSRAELNGSFQLSGNFEVQS